MQWLCHLACLQAFLFSQYLWTIFCVLDIVAALDAWRQVRPLPSSESLSSLSYPPLGTHDQINFIKVLWSLNMEVFACEPRTREAEAGRFQSPSHPSLCTYGLRQGCSLQDCMLTEKRRSCLPSEKFHCGKGLRHSKGRLGNPKCTPRHRAEHKKEAQSWE